MAKSKTVPAPDFDAGDYQAKSDADTLTRAEEIKGDKERHGKAQKHLRRRFHSVARAMTGGKKPNKFTARAKLAPDKADKEGY